MKSIDVDVQKGVTILRLDRGTTNALDLALLDELAETLRKVRTDPDISGLVLGSVHEKFFSIGFDVPELFGQDRNDFERFFKAFNRVCLDLYTLPKPTVAAITGHAVAGGCILALCCDYRFIAEGRKLMGLNEIKLGVPVPYLADCILRDLVGLGKAREIMDIGAFYPPEALLQIGMVDRVLPLESVEREATARAEELGSLPQRAFGMIKRNRVERTEKMLLERLDEREQFFVDSWYAKEAREALKKAIADFRPQEKSQPGKSD